MATTSPQENLYGQQQIKIIILENIFIFFNIIYHSNTVN